MASVIFRDDVSVELIRSLADDRYVAEAAWVSTKGREAAEGDDKRIPGLINYLARDRHGSPFEHTFFTFRIRCPIFVIREFHRHRAGWSYNEESGRYTKLQPEFYVPKRSRNLTQTGKPGHYVFAPGDDSQWAIMDANIRKSSQIAWDSYERQLSHGVAKEVARMSLGLNVYSSFYASCNARSLMHFLALRTESEDATFKSHPQHEIQMVADEMEELFADAMPYTWLSWHKNGRVAP